MLPNALVQTVAPTAQAVTWDDARAHLRIDAIDERALVESYINAATQQVEAILGRQLIHATWRYSVPTFPANCLALPRPPLVSIASVIYRDQNGVAQTWDAAEYQAGTDTDPGLLAPKPGFPWPSVGQGYADAIRVTYVAGYGETAASVPEPIRLAILQLVATWFENRESIIVGTSAAKLPQAVEYLLSQYRNHWPL